MRGAEGEVWSTDDVSEYERTRFRNLDQRLVARLEERAVAELVEVAAAPGERVLDVPSGYGRLSRIAAGGGGVRRVVLADVSREMLASARGRVRGGAPACCADVRSLPFADGAFDGALCVRLVQHLRGPDDRRVAFAELARVTERWAVVSVYRKAGLHHLQRRFLGRGRMCVSLDRLRTELREEGWRVRRVEKPLPVLHAQTLLLLRRLPS